MKISIDTSSYNERRNGKPWIAKVTFNESGDAVYDFGNWIGENGGPGILEIDVNAGDVIARGQKDFRKPANSAPDFYIVKPGAKNVTANHMQAMYESGFDPVSKKDAYLHFKNSRFDKAELEAEKQALLKRIAEIDQMLA